LVTPPFPAYTSGHSTFSSSAAAVLAALYGDAYPFTTHGDIIALPGLLPRSFDGFSAAAAEAGQSRIYGGIHWQFDNQVGLASGQALGEFVFATRLEAVPEPSTIVLWTLAGVGLVGLARRRRQPRG